jgi:hypothetical protein
MSLICINRDDGSHQMLWSGAPIFGPLESQLGKSMIRKAAFIVRSRSTLSWRQFRRDKG